MLLGSWVFLLVCNRTDVGESDLPSGDGPVVRSPARSPEFAPYFENVVRTSKTVGEAVHRFGYANSSIIYHHLKRLGIEAPLQWRLKAHVSLKRQERVPTVIMKSPMDRAWSGGMVQGEGGVIAHYSKRVNVTALDVRVEMTDQDPVFRLCDLFGIARPPKSLPKEPNRKPKWACVVGGLRAYRVLQEILPFLFGGKLKEAERALQFFAPGGYHKGRFGGIRYLASQSISIKIKGTSVSRALMDPEMLKG